MAWAKRKAMTWEWFEHITQVGDVAAKCAALAGDKHKIMFVLPLQPPPLAPASFGQNIMVITCKGTPVPTVKKTKEASE